MAITVLASTYKQGTTGSVTSDAINITGASLVVIIADYVASTTPTVSDNASNTPVSVITASDATEKQTIYYIESPTTNAAYQVTVAATSSSPAVYVLAVSGSALSGSLDQSGQSGTAPNVTSRAVTVTTTTDGQLVVSGEDQGDTFNPSVTGVTEDGSGLSIIGGTSFGIHAGKLIQTSAGSITATWSMNSSTRSVVTLATFKAASAAAVAPARTMIINS